MQVLYYIVTYVYNVTLYYHVRTSITFKAQIDVKAAK